VAELDLEAKNLARFEAKDKRIADLEAEVVELRFELAEWLDLARGLFQRVSILDEHGKSKEILSEFFALKKEVAGLRGQAADDKLAFDTANDVIGKLEADLTDLREQVKRLSKPVSDEEWYRWSWETNTPNHTRMTGRSSINRMYAARAGQKEDGHGD